MTYAPGRHVYLAAPFFNDEQRAVCDSIERTFAKVGLPLYSPRLDGGVLRPDSSQEIIKSTFNENVLSIRTASWILAVIDDFDPGTIWEMGAAFSLGVETLAFTSVPDRGLNVMLQGSSKLGFIHGVEELEGIIRKWAGFDASAFPRNTWSGSVQ